MSSCSPDLDRPDGIGEFWGHPETRTLGELLIDLEEDKAARAVVSGLLAHLERKPWVGHEGRGRLWDRER